MRTVKDLQEKIERHRQNIAKYTASHSISISIASEQAEIIVCACQLAEISTRRIIRLTWALLIFTIALFAVEVRAIFFPKDITAHPENVETSTKQQVVIPSVTK